MARGRNGIWRQSTRKGRARAALLVVVVGAAGAAAWFVLRDRHHGAPRATPPATMGATTTASTTTARPTTTTEPFVRYRVQQGDTMTKIARRFHVGISAIVTANHLANADDVQEGATLLIPPASPVTLVVAPAQGRPGDAFHIELRGAVPSETVTFSIHSTRGNYVGGPHTAGRDGTVSATYESASGDPTGAYQVSAIGNLGTTAHAGFFVVPAAATTTAAPA